MQRCVIIQKDENGFGLTVSGDNPVFVQLVKEGELRRRTEEDKGSVITFDLILFSQCQVFDASYSSLNYRSALSCSSFSSAKVVEMNPFKVLICESDVNIYILKSYSFMGRMKHTAHPNPQPLSLIDGVIHSHKHAVIYTPWGFGLCETCIGLPAASGQISLVMCSD